MVVDTSALIAVLREEPDFSSYLNTMLGAQRLVVSAASWAEVGVVVLWRLPPGSYAKVRALRERLQLEVRRSTSSRRRSLGRHSAVSGGGGIRRV